MPAPPLDLRDKHRMRFAAIMLAATVSGCVTNAADPGDPPAGFEHAYAAPGCAPWDGYAVSLVLRHTALAPLDSIIEAGDDSQLHLEIYPRDAPGTRPSGIRLGTVRWPADVVVASGALCEGSRCTAIPSGSITVREADDTGRLRGIVDLTLAGNRSVRGTFAAEWRQRMRMCG
jgi:hypothetical protein